MRPPDISLGGLAQQEVIVQPQELPTASGHKSRKAVSQLSRYVYGVSCRVRAKSYPRWLSPSFTPKVWFPRSYPEVGFDESALQPSLGQTV